MLSIYSITLFPDQVRSFFLKGLIAKALEKKCFGFRCIDLRDFGVGKHKKVDEYPFSEKKGMLIRADVLFNAVTSIEDYQNKRIIYTCPKGRTWTQKSSQALYESQKDIILISGYYEGVDERIFDLLPIERVSVGDYIVNSGDSAAVVIAETVIRQVSGVLGNSDCIDEDSHCMGLLEWPQYTSPVEFEDQRVPELLRSGNHQKIADYKQKESLRQTLIYRPDLLGDLKTDDRQRQLVTEIIKEMAVEEHDK